MDFFQHRDGVLHAEDVDLERLAEEIGTPFYCYSEATLVRHLNVFREGVASCGKDPLVAYAVKANPNQAVIACLAREGAGADVVSIGELRRALAAGVPADRIVFSGVGKTREEMAEALAADILQFNLESTSEADMLAEVARAAGRRPRAAFRVNPDVDAGTHAKISTGRAENKFGIPIDTAAQAFSAAAASGDIDMVGVAVHIGSQLTDLSPLEAAFRRVGDLIGELRAGGHDIRTADLGGGLGIPYSPDSAEPPLPADYGKMVAAITEDWNVRLIFEPGRLITGNAGILVSRVIRLKQGVGRCFVIIDAAMNDLMRPTLYDAYHGIEAVRPRGGEVVADIVGPVCETGDTFARDRALPRLEAGDLIVFRTAGAYSATMASTYNSRLLTPEVLVSGERSAVIRPRRTYEDLIGQDRIPDWIAKE
ncbi:diaminopimelate decarboxylase [Pacificimonas flava]|uniref:Diaminopimelate decarboxylase n=2 Tax=Pacificimonas TaxID=1960290 RepID=A0A219B354_9SPHN|nr:MULTISPECIES: diaminopimelate decarboxylase [Pacificimonas]MBZ6378102.1 diaminopimelate decarboxylase [Pacificimonas aurantium]OWV32259.1 diaminopimelate decarboxylase [Pacificimonas flava]